MLSRMTALALAAACCLAGTQPRIAAPAEPPPVLACVERLTLPRYPPIASSARVEIAGLKASIELGSDATLRSVSFDEPLQNSPAAQTIRKLFIRSVEASLRGAQYRPECGAQTLTFVFDFRLSRGPDEDGRVVFVYPNRFQLSDITPVVSTSTAPIPEPTSRKR